MATRDKSDLIQATLRGLASDVTRVGHLRWQFVRANGSVVPMHARLNDTWLELTTEVPEAPTVEIGADWWLRFNAALNGPVRAVSALWTDQVRLSADLNIEEDIDVAERVATVCDEMGAALHRCHVEHDSVASRCAQGHNHAAADDLTRLCVDAGWLATRGAAGELRIDLDGGAGPAAYLDSDLSDALRVVIELGDLSGYSPASRRSVGLILLAVSASVRSVKGLLVERDGAECAALATAAPWPGSATALDRSLSALAVARQAVWREVSALRDESLARAYIERWNLPRSSDNRVVNSTVTKEEHACLQQP